VSNKEFTVYPGKFPCKRCGIEVTSLRYWRDTGDATWMCEQKHVSKVNLLPPTKKDYERKERK
jgi:hypothetical protein